MKDYTDAENAKQSLKGDKKSDADGAITVDLAAKQALTTQRPDDEELKMLGKVLGQSIADAMRIAMATGSAANIDPAAIAAATQYLQIRNDLRKFEVK